MKKILIAVLALLSIVYAQNIMTIDGTSGNPGDTIMIVVDIDNVDIFVGFQFDLKLSDQITYVEGSAVLSDRKTDHQVVGNLYGSDSLTLFAYSMSNDAFSGTSGEVLRFNVVLGTVPGDYALTLLHATIANTASENILTAAVNGNYYILSPDIDISPRSIDYGRLPLLQTSDRSFTIQNNGNSDLVISSITSDLADFEVLGTTAFTLSSGQSQSVTVRFHSNTKGTYEQQVTVVSDDPDEALEVIDLSGTAFAVNELDINDIFGRSGHVSTLSIDISNMEPFVAFSFDLNIPDAMTLMEGSAELSDRKTDHVVSATTLENGNVRVVAYSPGNEMFTGTSGNVMTLDFLIDGMGGNYSITFVDPVIGDAEGSNIISDDYSGFLEIAAPDIDINSTTLAFGDVSIYDTLTLSPVFYNLGSDTLTITHLIFYDPHFYTDQLLPLEILPGQDAIIPVSFHNGTKENITSQLRVRSNDPDEDPFDISLSAASFIPNIMRIDSSAIVRNDTGWVHISIENHETIVGFECDLHFPSEFTYLDESRLSGRAGDHMLSATEESGNSIHLFSYSMTQTSFSDEEGVIVSLKFLGPADMDDYAFALSDVIIANTASENVMSSYESGWVSIITSGPSLEAFPAVHLDEDMDTLINISSWVSDPNTSFSDLIWTFSNNDPIILSVIGEDLHIAAAADWNGTRTIQVEVDDNELQDNTTFSVTFDPVNDPPVAQAGNDQTNEEISLEIILTATDIDSEAGSLVFSVIDSTMEGYLEGAAPYLTYVPNEDFHGYDSLRFDVSDGSYRDTATFLIEVLPVNDAPVWSALPDTSFNEDDSLKVHLSEVVTYLSDADNLMEDLTLSYYVPEVFHYGLIDSILYLAADPDWFGQDSIVICASDGTDSAEVIWCITVLPVNDPPVFTDFVDEPLSFNADRRDTTVFSEFFRDIDTPDSLVIVSVVSTGNIMAEVSQSRAELIFYINENISVNDSVEIILNDGDNVVSAYLDIEITEVAIDIIPEEFALHTPYPNPFNPIVTIPFDIPEICDVSVEIYDISGKIIKTLVRGSLEARTYRAVWNGTNQSGKTVPSGIYICRLTAHSDNTLYINHQKLLFVK